MAKFTTGMLQIITGSPAMLVIGRGDGSGRPWCGTFVLQAGHSQGASSGSSAVFSGGFRHFSWYARLHGPSHRMMSLSCRAADRHQIPTHCSPI